MEKEAFLDRFADKLMPIATKLNANRYLAAIRDGFFAAMSIIIVGSIFLIFPNFPYQGFIDFLNNVFGNNWILFCDRAYDMSVNIMTIYVIIGISKSLGNFYKLDTISSVVPALLSYFLLTPTIMGSEGEVGLPISNFGATGLFLGMLTAILAVEISHLIIKKGWKIKMPDTVPSNVSRSFESLIPVTFIFFIFLFIFFGFKVTRYDNAQHLYLKYCKNL